MAGPAFWTWIAKAVLSAAYWMTAIHLIAPLMFGDRLGADGAIMSGTPAWVAWAAVAGAVLLYALLSKVWDGIMARSRPTQTTR